MYRVLTLLVVTLVSIVVMEKSLLVMMITDGKVRSPAHVMEYVREPFGEPASKLKVAILHAHGALEAYNYKRSSSKPVFLRDRTVR